MKICYITYALPHQRQGGLENRIYQISQQLIKSGHEVYAVTLNFSGNPGKSVDANGIKINQIGLAKNIPIIGSYVFFILSSMISRLRRNFDVIDCVEPTLLPIIEKCRRSDSAIISTTGAMYSKFLDSLRFKNLKNLYYSSSKLIQNIITMKTADRIICKSRLAKWEAVNIFGISKKKTDIIYAGVDTKKFRPSINPQNIIEKHDLHDKTVLLFVGRLYRQKGLDYLLKSLPIVLKRNRNVRLLIIGKGPFKKELEKIIIRLNLQDQIIFIGSISHEELPKYYSVSDIFVLPSSFHEGLGIVLLEAMSCRKPVIATNIGGIPEIVKNGENGILVSPQNSEGLAEAIIQLINNPDYSYKLGENGRRYVEKNHSWNIVSNKTLNAYEKALEMK